MILFLLEMQCPDPPTVEKGEFRLHSGVNKLQTLGSYVTYTCKTGYELKDANNSMLHCVLDPEASTAIWKGEIPVCKGKICCIIGRSFHEKDTRT